MTFEQKKQAAFDALDVVGHGMQDATARLPNTRSACGVIESRLRDAIDEYPERPGEIERDRLLRRTRIVIAIYLDVAESAEFPDEDMVKMVIECNRLEAAVLALMSTTEHESDGGKR